MTVEVVAADDLLVVEGGVGVQVDDVGVGEILCKLVKTGGEACAGTLGLCIGFKELVAGHGDKEELGLGCDGPVLLDDTGVVTGHGFRVLCGIVGVDVRHLTQLLLHANQIVDAQRDDVRLRAQGGIPPAALLCIALAVLGGGHAAAGEIVSGKARRPCQELTPGIFKHIIIVMVAAVGAGDLKLARGQTVTYAGDGAENAGKATVGHNAVKRLFVGGRSVVKKFIHDDVSCEKDLVFAKHSIA